MKILDKIVIIIGLLLISYLVHHWFIDNPILYRIGMFISYAVVYMLIYKAILYFVQLRIYISKSTPEVGKLFYLLPATRADQDSFYLLPTSPINKDLYKCVRESVMYENGVIILPKDSAGRGTVYPSDYVVNKKFLRLYKWGLYRPAKMISLSVRAK